MGAGISSASVFGVGLPGAMGFVLWPLTDPIHLLQLAEVSAKVTVLLPTMRPASR